MAQPTNKCSLTTGENNTFGEIESGHVYFPLLLLYREHFPRRPTVCEGSFGFESHDPKIAIPFGQSMFFSEIVYLGKEQVST